MDYLNDNSVFGADVLVIPMTGDLSCAIQVSTRLRNSGIRTQIYFEQKKFKHKIGYADKLRIPYAAFIGEDEIASGKVTVKNMKTGEQRTEALDVLIPVIQEELKQNQAQKIISIL